MEQKHHYGPKVHLLDDRFAETLLAELCSPQTKQPRINHLVKQLYGILTHRFMSNELVTEGFQTPTRMAEMHPQALLTGQRISPNQSVVCVDLARAGILPSQLTYDRLHEVLMPDGIRQDHIFASRTTNNSQSVTGTQFGAVKIGGPVTDALVVIADPMGATGGTIISTLDYYKKQVPGPAKKYIALHLIVTPEYLKKVTQHHPDAIVYALRVDRGLSPQRVLQAELGAFWDEEIGLNQFGYIVPGAGGLGEIMNNSFV